MKSNPNHLCLLFFILYHLYFPSLSVLCPPRGSMPPSALTFPEMVFPSNSSSFDVPPSPPSLSLSVPSCSLLTANAAPLMGVISSLNTCRCLLHDGRDGERDRAATGVVQALSNMTYSQIYLC